MKAVVPLRLTSENSCTNVDTDVADHVPISLRGGGDAKVMGALVAELELLTDKSLRPRGR